MTLDFLKHLPQDFSDASKVWIYQSNRLLGISEAFQLEEMFNDFLKNWKSHGSHIKGYINLFFGQFIIVMADMPDQKVCGGATDLSVRFIKKLEKEFNISLLDRQLLAFVVKDRIELIPLSQLEYAFENGFIDKDTLYFDNHSVLNKSELEEKWIVPVCKSWVARKIKTH